MQEFSTSRRFRIALAILIALTLARVATTHRVFSHTIDEPWHLAGGYDVLVKRSWMTDPHHPPLARVFFALPFVGTPEPPAVDARTRGNMLLLRNDRYTQNLARARIGNLLFLALGIIAVARWGSHVLSPKAGLLASALFALLPPVLAHAGLATTDMAAAATVPLALDALTRFFDAPSWRRSIYLGVAVGAGMLAKYSFYLYFPLAALALIAVRAIRAARTIASWQFVAAVVLAIALLFAGFGGDLHPLFEGLEQVREHNRTGHRAFLFDEMSWTGWWYYFPVALFFKTPIPFLVLSLAGCALLARKRPEIPLAALAILAAAMTSHINIGVRHVLPIYAPLAIAAAAAVLELRRFRVASIALVAWLAVSGAVAHPDYLPWFNAFAGDHPERVLNDSNLDWGQDVLRLVRVARREKIEPSTLLLFTSADLARIGMPPHEELHAMRPVEGWFAISEMQIAIGKAHSPEVRAWLSGLIDGKPYRRIGKTIRLYDLRAR